LLSFEKGCGILPRGVVGVTERELREDAAIRKMSHYQYMSLSEWSRRGYKPSASWYVNHFGSWLEAWKAAGVHIPDSAKNRAIERSVRWTREAILEAMKDVSDKRGYVPAHLWEREVGSPAVGTIRKVFGTWDAAWKELGVKSTVDDRLRQFALNTAKLENRYITTSEWTLRQLQPSITIIRRLFGSWSAFMMEAGLRDKDLIDMMSSESYKGFPLRLQRMVRRRIAGASYGDVAKEFNISFQRTSFLFKRMRMLYEQEKQTGEVQVWHAVRRSKGAKYHQFKQRTF